MRKGLKIFKYIITFLCLLWIILSAVYSERLNAYLSTFNPLIVEGDATLDYFSIDKGIDFNLKPEETLSLPVTFEKRLARIGIYLGEQANSSDEYVFQLEDKYGMILGKTVKSLSEIKANDFVYIKSKAVISVDETYYIKIFSENADNAPLHIITSLADDFQTIPFSVGEKESENTLILEKHYQALNNNIVIYIDIALILIIVFVWCFNSNFIRKNLKELFNYCVKTIPWQKVNLAAITILVAVNVILLFLPEKQNMIQGGNLRSIKENEQAVPLEKGVVLEQHIHQGEGIINTVSVLFATYNQKIAGETVYFELLDDANENVIYSKSIASEEIHDNEYKNFLLPEPIDLRNNEICIRLWSDGASDNLHTAVYLNDNKLPEMYAQKNGETLDYNLVFDLSNQVKMYRLNISIIINGILLILIMLYIWNFIRFKHTVIKSILCSCLLSVLLLPSVLSALNYNIVSIEGMAASLWNKSNLTSYKEYDKEALDNGLRIEKDYNYIGGISAVYEHTEFPVNGVMSDITLEFDNETMPLACYKIFLYWDTGGRYNDRQSYVYWYVHQGKNTVSFQIPCNEAVQQVMLSIGQVANSSVDISSRIMPLTNVKLNTGISKNGVFSFRTALVYICINIFSVGIFLWKYFNIDNKIGKLFASKKVSVSIVFVIIASIYGLCFSFLTPTFQVPDEGAHISMLYTDIGNPDMPQLIYDSLGEQGQNGVILNAGRPVDIKSYIEASKNVLENYDLNYKSPSILILRRPGQVFGVLIGQLLHLPAYWILQLGEIGGLAVYIALGAVTLKIIPYKKNVMMLIMLLPIVMQEAGSFSYDSFTNAVSFFTIAYILYLKSEAKKVSWKQIALLIPLAVCLLICKVIYVLLLFLVFIVPLDKLELKIGKFTLNKEWIKSHKAITAISLSVFFCAAAFGSLIVVKMIGYGDVFQLLINYLKSFSQMIRLLVTNVIVNGGDWLRGLTTSFGWYDNPPNDLFMWFIIISAFIFALMHHKVSENNAEANKSGHVSSFTCANLTVWYGVFFVLFCVVQITMIQWGFLIHGIDLDLPYSVGMRLLPRIEGVQGRYFSPILPLLFIPLHTKKDILGFIPKWLYKIFYYFIVMLFPISLLLLRYWGIGSW